MTSFVAAPLPNALAQARLLVRRDLLVERRGGDVLKVTLPFAVAVLIVLALAVGADRPLLRTLGPGVYWASLLLFGTLVTLRPTGDDEPTLRDRDAMLGLEPTARVLARIASGTLLLLATAFALLPVATAVYDIDMVGWTWFLVLVPCVSLGLAAVGGLTVGLTRTIAGRASLGALLTVPLAVPLCVAATQVLDAARHHRTATAWVVLIAAVDVVALLVAVASAELLEEGA